MHGMKRLKYGFFMAWGMFLAIPCPRKLWDEQARSTMIACLPLVGGIVGGCWALLAWLLGRIPGHPWFWGTVLSFVPYFATGFLHLDGFMDCCDAILSRRDLTTRQRILKDSHCGAFAVICLAMLLLLGAALFAQAEAITLWSLALTPVSVRAAAGLAVFKLPVMSTSQYAAMETHSSKSEITLWVILAGACIVPACFLQWAPLAGALGYGLAVWYAAHNLGGFSGDVSGFGLTVGELIGAAVLILF